MLLYKIPFNNYLAITKFGIFQFHVLPLHVLPLSCEEKELIMESGILNAMLFIYKEHTEFCFSEQRGNQNNKN